MSAAFSSTRDRVSGEAKTSSMTEKTIFYFPPRKVIAETMHTSWMRRVAAATKSIFYDEREIYRLSSDLKQAVFTLWVPTLSGAARSPE
jgi:hypothetical protein